MSDRILKELEIVKRLATDALDLKVSNGWYGDPSQGATTFEEDTEALEHVTFFATEMAESIRNSRDRCPMKGCGATTTDLEGHMIIEHKAR